MKVICTTDSHVAALQIAAALNKTKRNDSKAYYAEKKFNMFGDDHYHVILATRKEIKAAFS